MQDPMYLVIGADGDNVTSEDGHPPRDPSFGPQVGTQPRNPPVNEYLDFLARQGWELVTAYSIGGSQVRLILKQGQNR